MQGPPPPPPPPRRSLGTMPPPGSRSILPPPPPQLPPPPPPFASQTRVANQRQSSLSPSQSVPGSSSAISHLGFTQQQPHNAPAGIADSNATDPGVRATWGRVSDSSAPDPGNPETSYFAPPPTSPLAPPRHPSSSNDASAMVLILQRELASAKQRTLEKEDELGRLRKEQRIIMEKLEDRDADCQLQELEHKQALEKEKEKFRAELKRMQAKLSSKEDEGNKEADELALKVKALMKKVEDLEGGISAMSMAAATSPNPHHLSPNACVNATKVSSESLSSDTGPETKVSPSISLSETSRSINSRFLGATFLDALSFHHRRVFFNDILLVHCAEEVQLLCGNVKGSDWWADIESCPTGNGVNGSVNLTSLSAYVRSFHSQVQIRIGMWGSAEYVSEKSDFNNRGFSDYRRGGHLYQTRKEEALDSSYSLLASVSPNFQLALREALALQEGGSVAPAQLLEALLPALCPSSLDPSNLLEYNKSNAQDVGKGEGGKSRVQPPANIAQLAALRLTSALVRGADGIPTSPGAKQKWWMERGINSGMDGVLSNGAGSTMGTRNDDSRLPTLEIVSKLFWEALEVCSLSIPSWCALALSLNIGQDSDTRVSSLGHPASTLLLHLALHWLNLLLDTVAFLSPEEILRHSHHPKVDGGESLRMGAFSSKNDGGDHGSSTISTEFPFRGAFVSATLGLSCCLTDTACALSKIVTSKDCYIHSVSQPASGGSPIGQEWKHTSGGAQPYWADIMSMLKPSSGVPPPPEASTLILLCGRLLSALRALNFMDSFLGIAHRRASGSVVPPFSGETAAADRSRAESAPHPPSKVPKKTLYGLSAASSKDSSSSSSSKAPSGFSPTLTSPTLPPTFSALSTLLEATTATFQSMPHVFVSPPTRKPIFGGRGTAIHPLQMLRPLVSLQVETLAFLSSLAKSRGAHGWLATIGLCDLDMGKGSKLSVGETKGQEPMEAGEERSNLSEELKRGVGGRRLSLTSPQSVLPISSRPRARSSTPGMEQIVAEKRGREERWGPEGGFGKESETTKIAAGTGNEEDGVPTKTLSSFPDGVALVLRLCVLLSARTKELSVLPPASFIGIPGSKRTPWDVCIVEYRALVQHCVELVKVFLEELENGAACEVDIVLTPGGVKQRDALLTLDQMLEFAYQRNLGRSEKRSPPFLLGDLVRAFDSPDPPVALLYPPGQNH